MAFPATDFAMCMYQVPDKYQINPSVKEIIALAKVLEMAKFSRFWRDAENVALLKSAVGWQKCVRNFIAGVVSSTYRSIESTLLLEFLNLPEAELDSFIKEQGWSRSKDNKSTIVVNTASFQSVRVEPQASATISLDQYKQLFTAATGA